MSAETPPIVVENVGYEYDSGLSKHHVLRDVSLKIEAGEIVILTGPSGSGKTTLITLIGALRAMQAGSIKIFGNELHKASQRALMKTRRNIGFIFQQHNLLDYLTVAQNISMSLSLGLGLSGAKARTRIEEVLDQVGLLKKELQQTLYIDTRATGRDRYITNTAAMIAAGLASSR